MLIQKSTFFFSCPSTSNWGSKGAAATLSVELAQDEGNEIERKIQNVAHLRKNRMVSFHGKFTQGIGKGLLTVTFIAGLILPSLGCQPKPLPSDGRLRILVDQAVHTLNPKRTLDATGQRLNALIFRALTQVDENLQSQPDLALRWESLQAGKTWKFWIRSDLQDHQGRPIHAKDIAMCLEQYREGKPISPLRGAFPTWKSTRVENNSAVIVELEKPDPYFPKNVSSLRFFRTSSAVPCSEPAPNEELIGSGPMRPEKWTTQPGNEFTLIPVEPGRRTLQFIFVKDEITRTLKMLRGEADLAQNSFSLTKTHWFRSQKGRDFSVIENDGVNVSYLAFNLSDPVLAKLEVRKAIASAIDREPWVQNKMFGLGSLAGSLLSPLLSENLQTPSQYSPIEAEKILDQAGYPRKKDGVRLRFRYKTTPQREGIETALILQDLLRKIGIELTLDVVEPAVFLSSVRKGGYQMYSSRWVGISDGSILFRTLRSDQRDNRAKYSDPKMDSLLDQAMEETDLVKRTRLLHTIQAKMAADLPYFPLWYWRNSVVMRKELEEKVRTVKLSLSGGYEPLTRIP